MKEKAKKILKENGLTGKDMAEELDLAYGSYKTSMSKRAKVPRWIKAFLFGHKLGQVRNIEVKDAKVICGCKECRCE